MCKKQLVVEGDVDFKHALALKAGEAHMVKFNIEAPNIPKPVEHIFLTLVVHNCSLVGGWKKKV